MGLKGYKLAQNFNEKLHTLNSMIANKSRDYERKYAEDIKSLQISYGDQTKKTEELRDSNVKVELLEDQIKKISSNVEASQNLFHTTLTQVNSIASRFRSIEESLQKQESRITKLEDKTLVNEGRIKDNQKTLEEQPKLKELINSNTRDLLVFEEDIEKVKKDFRSLEGKFDKGNNKKLSKKETSTLNNIESEMADVQEKIRSMEFTVEHLNEVKFEDFANRFKKEILEKSDNQLSKVMKGIKDLEAKTDTQGKFHDNLQKNISELKKKLDAETLRLQDNSFLRIMRKNAKTMKPN